MRKEILKLIENNSKLSVEDIAIMIGATKEAVEAEIAAMEADKVICGYTTLINWDKVDNDIVMALIEVKVTPQRGDGFDEIAKKIHRFDEVDTVYLMSGGYDLTVIVNGHSMKEVAGFVSRKLATMDYVESTSTHFLLKKYKEHGISLEEVHEDERMLITP
ncbi:MAG: Lrp/AsnC family transcriptional regulator [Lachnospiraceae bacterium]|nr:Lrp/AsnC family transcriptional regulator [Lachnospiraceae bacterium]